MAMIEDVAAMVHEYGRGEDEHEVAEKIVHYLVPPGAIVVSYHVARELARDIEEGRYANALAALRAIGREASRRDQPT
jgi:hypothetical protein